MKKKFPDILNNRMWHTTSIERFNNIIDVGSILKDPPLEDSERHTSKDGAQYNPLVRQLGGISLFNFAAFDPELYEKQYPSSTWYSFVPCYYRYDECVWIEIDKSKIQDNLIFADALKEIADRENIYGNRMPQIEVACMVDIKKEWFLDVLRYDENSSDFIIYEY
jgi:hypothetical protein